MITIHKYTLDPTEEQYINIRGLIKILSAAEQNDQIVVYVLVDTEGIQINRVTFNIHGTGHDAEDVYSRNFLGTVKLMDGKIMFHVFYRV